MTRLPQSEFVHALRTADTDNVVAFIAGLWAARGWDTTVDGRTITTIDEETGKRAVLRVVHRSGPLSISRRLRRSPIRGDVDAIVSIGRPVTGGGLARQGIEYIDETTLYEIAIYAVDEPTCERLFQTYLDRSSIVEESTSSLPSDSADADVEVFGIEGAVGRIHAVITSLTGRVVVSLFLLSVLFIAVGGVATHPSDDTGIGVSVPSTKAGIDRSTSTPVSSDGDDLVTTVSSPERDVKHDRAPGDSSRSGTDVKANQNSWRMFGFGPARTGYTPEARGPRRRVIETDRVNLKYPITSSPAIVDNTVYVNRYDGTVFAMNGARLTVEWRTPLGRPITTSPLVVDDVVYVATGERREPSAAGNRSSSAPNLSRTFYALSASNGSVRWALALGPIAFSSPAFVDDTVYVGSRVGRVYAVDMATGTVRWNASVDGEIRTSPAVANGTVYIGDSTGTIHALDAATGRERWQTTTASRIDATPAVANNTVYVGGSDARVYAFDTATGIERWNVSVDGAVLSSPAVATEFVYVGSRTGHLYALEVATGAVDWITVLDGRIVSSSAVANDTVYVGSQNGNVYSVTSEGRVYALDATTGGVRWNHTTTGPVSSSPAVVAGRLYVGDDYGGVHMFVECRPSSDRFGSPSVATRKQCR